MVREYRALCAESQRLTLLGEEDASLDEWYANTELADLVEDEITSSSIYSFTQPRLVQRFASVESDIAAFAEGTTSKSANSIFRELNWVTLRMDQNFIDYTPRDEISGYPVVLAAVTT